MSNGCNPNEIIISSALYIGMKNWYAHKHAIIKNMNININRFMTVPPFFVWFLILNLVNYEINLSQKMYKLNIN